MTRRQEIQFSEWKDITIEVVERFELGPVMFMKRGISCKDDVEKFANDKRESN